MRTLVVMCRDWSITASGYDSSDLVAVINGNKVISCSAGARGAGVEVGQRRRGAQSICPNLEIVHHDVDRDIKAFEVVVRLIEQFCPEVQVLQPGLCALSTKGPSKYFGGDESFVITLSKALDSVCSSIGAIYQIGIADGLFAASLAAEYSMIVEPKKSAEFLSPLPITSLNRPDLTSMLRRLGLKTLGAFAQLDSQQVLERFGPEGQLAHCLASGLDSTFVVPRSPDLELSAEVLIDPPAQRADIASFITKNLCESFVEKANSHGFDVVAVGIEMETEHGESTDRQWRFEDGCSPNSLNDRVRWQLDGWLSGSSKQKPTAGVNRVRIIPLEVRSSSGRQVELWGQPSEADTRAKNAIARLQGMLGAHAVFVAQTTEGRNPREKVKLVGWGQSSLISKDLSSSFGQSSWPGVIPSPSPTLLMENPTVVEVLDSDRKDVAVSQRGDLSSLPAFIKVDQSTIEIKAVAGPWTNDDLWWDVENRTRHAFLQLLADDGTGYLVFRKNGRWFLEGIYD